MSRIWMFTIVLALPAAVRADEPSLKKYTAPAESKKDEPLAKQFSMDKAVSFLDNAALQWTDKRGCFSCHTNISYLYARPTVDAKTTAHADIRNSLEDLVTKRWPDKKPRWDAEVVVAAAALAYNDSLTTKKLHPVTKTALDRMWTLQQKDGGFRWLKLNQPPMEFDDHYGVTLAALAVGVAPDGYARTDAAQKGVAGLRSWLKANPPQNIHHRAMILWVSTRLDGFMTADEQHAVKKELLARQLKDGGWSTASLGHWKRADGHEQTPDVSDGYGTGFTIFVLRQAGVPADDPALVKGIAWLKANQRTSGRWFTRSLVDDNNKHYLAHIGSSFAVMAIQACEGSKTAAEIRGFPKDELIAIGNVLLHCTLKIVETFSSNACAVTIKELAQHNPAFQPILPSIMPFMKSKSIKLRWAAIDFAASSKNEDVIDPILDVLKDEDCLYVIDISLQAFFRFKSSRKHIRGVEILLGKSVRLLDEPQPLGCKTADGAFFYWPANFPIEGHLGDRIARAISSVGPTAVPVLKDELQKNDDLLVKQVCVVAIRQIIDKSAASKQENTKKLAEGVLPILLAQLGSADEGLQISAIDAIRQAAVASNVRVPELAKIAVDQKRTSVVRIIAKRAIEAIDSHLKKGNP